MVSTGPPAPPWPEPPRCHVSSWESDGPYSSRLTLPLTLPQDARLGIGAVGPGWLELTDDPGAPVLPVTAVVGSKDRLTIEGAGVLSRFGASNGDRVLVTALPSALGVYLRVVAVDCLECALRAPTLRPTRLLGPPEWEQWRVQLLSGQ
jgi:hypothetical protein